MHICLPFFHCQDHLVLGRTGPLPLFPLARLSVEQRATHQYVLGITGQGKSKLLQHCLYQDIVAGRGCGVLDPHTDLVHDLLGQLYMTGYLNLAKNRDRIVYFEPTSQEFLLPFNVLATPYSPYITTMNIVEAFKRTWPESLREAPRFTNILQASLLTLIANELTLVELPRLLMNKDYREDLLNNVNDPEIVSVFHDRLDRWGREQPIILESVLNKLSAFALNPTLRAILGHPENHLDLRAIMDEGKVLLIDLGKSDGETRRLLGSLIVTFLEQAALSRKTEVARNRRPFYFYIDEFQQFCANEGSVMTLAQILSEARKFSLHLTLAHQTLGQLKSNYLLSAMGNIGTKIVFAVDRSDAEVMAKKLFTVDGEQIKHEVNDEDHKEKSHPVYYSLQENWEHVTQTIQNLKPRTCLVKAPRRTVAKVQTIRVRQYELSAPQWQQTYKWLRSRSVGELRFTDHQRKVETPTSYYEPIEPHVPLKTRLSLLSGQVAKA